MCSNLLEIDSLELFILFYFFLKRKLGQVEQSIKSTISQMI